MEFDPTGSTGIFSRPFKGDPIPWKGHPVSVVSLGCATRASLDVDAVQTIEQAEHIIGAKRHLDQIDHIDSTATRSPYPSPFSDTASLLEHNQDQRIVILASGDALFYGVGNWLIKLLGRTNCKFHPNVSSVQVAFHRIGLPWHHAQTVSLHGRPMSALRRHLANNRLLAIFTDNRNTPDTIAQELTTHGFGESRFWVCEQLGGAKETISEWKASELSDAGYQGDDLNICVVNVVGVQSTLPAFPGIKDEHFSTGAEPGFGMISKREVRLSIPSLLQPQAGETAWDIGAGCGSVSVEWARWNHAGQIYAIEHISERVEHIRGNSAKFGTELNLTVIEGNAPDCCDGLPEPDAIFVGGSGGLGPMLDFAWGKLLPGGKLVASAVTEESRQALHDFLADKTGREWLTISLDKDIGGATHTFMPVTLGKCTKPTETST